MFSSLSRLAGRPLHPQDNLHLSHTRLNAAARAPSSCRIPKLYHPARTNRGFHHASPALEKAWIASQNFCDLDRLPMHFRQAATPAERLDIARRLAHATKAVLGEIYLNMPKEEPDQEKLKARIQWCFSQLSPHALPDLRQALVEANFSVRLIRAEVDDEMLRDYGFTNGPPHCNYTTELVTEEFYRLLDQAAQGRPAPEDL